jgi:hypothetical protein
MLDVHHRKPLNCPKNGERVKWGPLQWYVVIVPKRGMGRNHCSVFHDGQNIIGSKTELVPKNWTGGLGAF